MGGTEPYIPIGNCDCALFAWGSSSGLIPKTYALGSTLPLMMTSSAESIRGPVAASGAFGG